MTAPKVNFKIVRNPSEPHYWPRIRELAIHNESWFNTPSDYDIWIQGFGQDDFSLWVAIDIDKDVAIGSATAANYRKLDGSPLMTFIGMVMVDPAYRGAGIGIELSKKVMEKDTGFPNKGLIAMPSMAERYRKKFGFVLQPEKNMVDVEVATKDLKLSAVESPDFIVKEATEADWDKILAYDRELVKETQRDKFMKLYCTQPDSYYRIATTPDESKILGVCLIRTLPETKLLYTGPFYAESEPIAVALFTSAFQAIRDPQKYESVRFAGYHDSPTVDFVKKIAPGVEHHFSHHFTQFTERIIEIPRPKIFSITENDVTHM
uniref:N-acetyltransferase domain-containing protein n=1 Tax=Panagrellus redivivus TaxID=6233 RepID=A0A7E4VA99_PANRE